MRKISAHYYLLPDGSLCKWPVITLDNEGDITEVRGGEHLSEEPGLEYYGGVLVPGFIEDLRNIDLSDADEEEMLRLINRFNSLGSVRFLCDAEHKYTVKGVKGRFFFDDRRISENRVKLPERSFWERVREGVSDTENVLQRIHFLQKEIIKSLPDEVKWGRIEEGCSPGLILIKGLDYERMSLTERTTVKILDY